VRQRPRAWPRQSPRRHGEPTLWRDKPVWWRRGRPGRTRRNPDKLSAHRLVDAVRAGLLPGPALAHGGNVVARAVRTLFVCRGLHVQTRCTDSASGVCRARHSPPPRTSDAASASIPYTATPVERRALPILEPRRARLRNSAFSASSAAIALARFRTIRRSRPRVAFRSARINGVVLIRLLFPEPSRGAAPAFGSTVPPERGRMLRTEPGQRPAGNAPQDGLQAPGRAPAPRPARDPLRSAGRP